MTPKQGTGKATSGDNGPALPAGNLVGATYYHGGQQTRDFDVGMEPEDVYSDNAR